MQLKNIYFALALFRDQVLKENALLPVTDKLIFTIDKMPKAERKKWIHVFYGYLKCIAVQNQYEAVTSAKLLYLFLNNDIKQL
jgi:hypothetical protein